MDQKTHYTNTDSTTRSSGDSLANDRLVQWGLAAIMILTIVAARSIPHMPNFAPVTAIGIFAGYVLRSRLMAMSIVLLAMFISDLMIGFASIEMRMFIYATFFVPVLFGRMVRRVRPLDGSQADDSGLGRAVKYIGGVTGSSLASSLIFFVLSNLAVFILFNYYPKTWAGLVQCYVMAIPFLRGTLLGDLMYTGLFFAAFEMARFVMARMATRNAQVQGV